MIFARKVWHFLVGIKDGLVLLFMLLFFMALYAVLTMRPSAGTMRDGALLLRLNGTVVEEPAERDPFDALIGEWMARVATHKVAAGKGFSESNQLQPVMPDPALEQLLVELFRHFGAHSRNALKGTLPAN